MAALLACCCCGGLGASPLYADWDAHPAALQYRCLRRLGEGGFSEVQLAADRLTGRTVALKIIFLNRPGLTPQQARAGEMDSCARVASAVAYLHALGILHRDVKPENCLLAKPAAHYAAKGKPPKARRGGAGRASSAPARRPSHGRARSQGPARARTHTRGALQVKLIDLGMSGLFRPGRPLTGCMGSPGFISPEVVLGEPHTPAMDVYSLGVLLFVMLVGRKPWDAARSHTLAYAVERTADAPGLAEPSFGALSPSARQLLAAMLAEDPRARPSAAEVLAHPWLAGAAAAPGGGGAPDAPIAPAVQQRLRVLGNSRQVMGTARGMMMLHGRGSRSGAAAFHAAVREARLALAAQAGALRAAGQLQALAADPGAAASGAGAGEPPRARRAAAAPASDGTGAASGSGTGTGTGSATQGPAGGGTQHAAGSTAAGQAPVVAGPPAPPAGRQGSATVGQLARARLHQRSLLFGGQRPTPPAPAGAGAPPAAAASPDPLLGWEALERGMSLPNPDAALSAARSPAPAWGGARRCVRARAVSLSPDALALLDADDRRCLLEAGTSADDDGGGDGAFGWLTAAGDDRGGAAGDDMVASFRRAFLAPAAGVKRPTIMRSIARLGQSLSSSIGRSLRQSGGLAGSHRLGSRHAPAGGASGAGRALSLSSDGGGDGGGGCGGSTDLDSLLAAGAPDSCQPLASRGLEAASAPRQLLPPQAAPAHLRAAAAAATSGAAAVERAGSSSVAGGTSPELAFLGTALSMSPPAARSPAPAPGSGLAAALARRGEAFAALPRVLPAIPSEPSGSAAASASASSQDLEGLADSAASAVPRSDAAPHPRTPRRAPPPALAATRRALRQSPSVRAAATAAATRAEEEGLDLPNGLWLQRSASIDSAAAAAASGRLASPLGAAPSAALDLANGLSLADVRFAVAQEEEEEEAAPCAESIGGSGSASSSSSGRSSSSISGGGVQQAARGGGQRHTRDVSVTDWLSLCGLPASEAGREVSVLDWLGEAHAAAAGGEQGAAAPSPARGARAAGGGAGGRAQARLAFSRCVAVPGPSGRSARSGRARRGWPRAGSRRAGAGSGRGAGRGGAAPADGLASSAADSVASGAVEGALGVEALPVGSFDPHAAGLSLLLRQGSGLAGEPDDADGGDGADGADSAAAARGAAAAGAAADAEEALLEEAAALEELLLGCAAPAPDGKPGGGAAWGGGRRAPHAPGAARWPGRTAVARRAAVAGARRSTRWMSPRLRRGTTAAERANDALSRVA
ncbi:hypothetical protein HT031_005933 [Scenedesmus sp. PABB004]|nr:hypothetical protein HT031_005933 [Scenedesmus sp. PABB004]